MRLLLHRIAILLIAAGLMFGGGTSHGFTMSAADEGATIVHADHQIQSYADLAIEPGDSDCPHLASGKTGDVPLPHNDGPCKKCCAACMTVSLMPDAPVPLAMVSQPFVIHVAARKTLVAHGVPTDPGIPKPL